MNSIIIWALALLGLSFFVLIAIQFIPPVLFQHAVLFSYAARIGLQFLTAYVLSKVSLCHGPYIRESNSFMPFILNHNLHLVKVI